MSKKKIAIIAAAAAAAAVFLIAFPMRRDSNDAAETETQTQTAAPETKKETQSESESAEQTSAETQSAAEDIYEDIYEHEEFSGDSAAADAFANFTAAVIAAQRAAGKTYASDSEFLRECFSQNKNCDAKTICEQGEIVSVNSEMAGDAVVFLDENSSPVHAGVMVGKNYMVHVRDGTAVRELVSSCGKKFAFRRMFSDENISPLELSVCAKETGFVLPKLIYTSGANKEAFDGREYELALHIGDLFGENFQYAFSYCEVSQTDDMRREGECYITVRPQFAARTYAIIYDSETGKFK